jgi:hypothetical protein
VRFRELEEYKRVEGVIVDVIKSSSRPYLYSDEVTLEFFNSVARLVASNYYVFSSDIGI